MTDELESWRGQYVNFSRLLTLFEQELAAFARDESDHVLMRDLVLSLRQYADRHHRLREGLLFEPLVAGDPDLAIPVERLRQEYRVLEVAGNGLAERLEELMSDVLIGREPIESDATTFLVYLRHHLMVEERDLLPRAASLLGPEHRQALRQACEPQLDPLFGEQPDPRFLELRRRLQREA